MNTWVRIEKSTHFWKWMISGPPVTNRTTRWLLIKQASITHLFSLDSFDWLWTLGKVSRRMNRQTKVFIGWWDCLFDFVRVIILLSDIFLPYTPIYIIFVRGCCIERHSTYHIPFQRGLMFTYIRSWQNIQKLTSLVAFLAHSFFFFIFIFELFLVLSNISQPTSNRSMRCICIDSSSSGLIAAVGRGQRLTASRKNAQRITGQSLLLIIVLISIGIGRGHRRRLLIGMMERARRLEGYHRRWGWFHSCERFTTATTGWEEFTKFESKFIYHEKTTVSISGDWKNLLPLMIL